MERHQLDVVSLVAGSLFVALGIAVVFGGLDAFSSGRGWILPGTLIGLGALIAAVALNRELRRREEEEAEEEGEAAADADEEDATDVLPPATEADED